MKLSCLKKNRIGDHWVKQNNPYSSSQTCFLVYEMPGLTFKAII